MITYTLPCPFICKWPGGCTYEAAIEPHDKGWSVAILRAPECLSLIHI